MVKSHIFAEPVPYRKNHGRILESERPDGVNTLRYEFITNDGPDPGLDPSVRKPGPVPQIRGIVWVPFNPPEGMDDHFRKYPELLDAFNEVRRQTTENVQIFSANLTFPEGYDK